MLADNNKLEQIVEGILFVAGQGVELKDIAEKLEVDIKEVEKVIENLKEKHKDDGFNVITYKKSAQMCSNPDFADDIATVLNPIREKQLTKAALETLAIIAYKQPITRLDIEQVRGVNSDYAVQILTNFKLIEVVGRKDAIGKPLLFGTTDEFLKRFDLQTIDDLPDYEELLSRIKILHEPVTDSLYKSTEIIPEEELPDSLDRKEKLEEEKLKNEKLKEEKLENSESQETLSEEGSENTFNSEHLESEYLVQSNNDKDNLSKNHQSSNSSSEDIVIETLKEAYLDEDEDDIDDDFLGKDSDLL